MKHPFIAVYIGRHSLHPITVYVDLLLARSKQEAVGVMLERAREKYPNYKMEQIECLELTVNDLVFMLDNCEEK